MGADDLILGDQENDKYNFGCFRCGKTSLQKIKNHQGYVWCPFCDTQNSVGALLLDDIAGLKKEIERLKEYEWMYKDLSK